MKASLCHLSRNVQVSKNKQEMFQTDFNTVVHDSINYDISLIPSAESQKQERRLFRVREGAPLG